MSDYCGNANLEDWLREEIFYGKKVPKNVVERFEKWRDAVETNIEQWMLTDDGEGNNVSWRGWGRGFNAIPESDNAELGSAIRFGLSEINM